MKENRPKGVVGASLQITSILGKSSGKLANVEVLHLNDNKVLWFMVAGWIRGLEPLLSSAALYSTDTLLTATARRVLLLHPFLAAMRCSTSAQGCATEGYRARLGKRAWMGNYLLSETTEKKQTVHFLNERRYKLIKNASPHYKCSLQVRFSLCYFGKWSRQYVCFHFMSFAWWFVCFQIVCVSFALDTAFTHKHFSFMQLCITRVTLSFPRALTSKSDSKHDTVWLDVNSFSVILHFTRNNTLINCRCDRNFFTSSSFSHLPSPCSPHFV